ncbi:metallo-beta-lactamase class B [Filimonas lacunae]|uniref:Metallo-beta-lactamase class B n=1 Tax=Filimonas lacunae TaxID=477680 RepID=A0A173MFP5_9BACT|nr:subclass B3 metallo-beta-lactamase [Filimonas lacunae]BAV06405.1 metallo-beta-lactamase precursor [Filimonas lacunae]SIT26827.1 metallo-beta-lactamase class B [Filimonas lacunae]
MTTRLFTSTALLVCALTAHYSATAQQVKEPTDTPPEWSKPYQPFQIVGNLYYVGTFDLASYLITTSKGNIIINTGLASSAEVITSNIKQLGFRPEDTKVLLTTQAHYDHMGAMAVLQKQTGARVMIDEKDVPVATDGGNSDYALGGNGSTYQPVKVNRTLHNNDTIQLDNMVLTLLHHPGHTKGSCSYIFTVTDSSRSYKVLIANMPTIVTEKKFSEVTSYPDIAKDYAYTLDAMKKLRFDIWLSSHASQFNLHKKRKQGQGYHPDVFMEKADYYKTLNDLQTQYNKKIAG